MKNKNDIASWFNGKDDTTAPIIVLLRESGETGVLWIARYVGCMCGGGGGTNPLRVKGRPVRDRERGRRKEGRKEQQKN